MANEALAGLLQGGAQQQPGQRPPIDPVALIALLQQLGLMPPTTPAQSAPIPPGAPGSISAATGGRIPPQSGFPATSPFSTEELGAAARNADRRVPDPAAMEPMAPRNRGMDPLANVLTAPPNWPPDPQGSAGAEAMLGMPSVGASGVGDIRPPPQDILPMPLGPSPAAAAEMPPMPPPMPPMPPPRPEPMSLPGSAAAGPPGGPVAAATMPPLGDVPIPPTGAGLPKMPIPGGSMGAPSGPEPGRRQNKEVVIQRGDSLWKIAEREYGDGRQWRVLWKANPGIRNPDKIYFGAKLVIPPLPMPTPRPSGAAGDLTS